MTTKIKIILAEGNELFRKALKSLLKETSQFEILIDTSSGKEVLDTLKNKFCNVVLLDVNLPVLEGKAVLEIIKVRFPESKVIMWSTDTSIDLMSEFMARGANAFLSKNCEVETLLNAITTVYSEGYYFNKNVSKAMLESLLKQKSQRANGGVIEFNDRESEILAKICDGLTNKEIAACMHLSASTIDFHRTRIYSKVKCTNVAQLIKFALKNGHVALS